MKFGHKLQILAQQKSEKNTLYACANPETIPFQKLLFGILKARIHGAILRAVAKLHRVSTPKIMVRSIATVEFRPTSATLRPTNFCVYPTSATFRAIM